MNGQGIKQANALGVLSDENGQPLKPGQHQMLLWFNVAKTGGIALPAGAQQGYGVLSSVDTQGNAELGIALSNMTLNEAIRDLAGRMTPGLIDLIGTAVALAKDRHATKSETDATFLPVREGWGDDEQAQE